MNLSRRWLLDYVDINGISDKEFRVLHPGHSM